MLFDSSPETLNLLQQSLAYTLYFRRKELWQRVLPPRADISSAQCGLAAAVGEHIGLSLPSIHIRFQLAKALVMILTNRYINLMFCADI